MSRKDSNELIDTEVYIEDSFDIFSIPKNELDLIIYNLEKDIYEMVMNKRSKENNKKQFSST